MKTVLAYARAVKTIKTTTLTNNQYQYLIEMHRLILEKVTIIIAMYYHLRPPDAIASAT